MQDLLIIIHDYYPNPSANTICVEKIINQLKQLDYRISVVSVKPHRKLLNYEMVNNVEVYRFVNYFDLFSRWLRRFSFNGSRKLRKIIHRILAKSFSIINQKELEGYVSKWDIDKITNAIINFNKTRDFSKMITISLPFVTNIIGYNVKCILPNIKWIAYELDPFTYCYTLKSNRKQRELLELRLFDKVDKIISTEGIVEENNRHNFRKEYLNKTFSLPLPNLTDNTITKNDQNNALLKFDENKINIVYTGYFYGALIRSPEYILKFLKNLNNKDIVLHVFGGGCDALLNEYKLFFGERLNLYGPTEKKICEQALFKANILLNIGNNIPNQTPSKVFEYIGTGKPIINVYYVDNDTSLKYLNKYPLSYNIKIDSQISDNSKDNFNSFCYKNKHKKLSWEVISNCMGDLTTDNVVQKFIEIIK